MNTIRLFLFGLIGHWEKGVNFDTEQRYSTVSDLYQDLRYPNSDFLRDDPPAQNSSGSLLFWKLLSGFWFGVFVLLVYLFSQVFLVSFSS